MDEAYLLFTSIHMQDLCLAKHLSKDISETNSSIQVHIGQVLFAGFDICSASINMQVVTIRIFVLEELFKGLKPMCLVLLKCLDFKFYWILNKVLI